MMKGSKAAVTKAEADEYMAFTSGYVARGVVEVIDRISEADQVPLLVKAVLLFARARKLLSDPSAAAADAAAGGRERAQKARAGLWDKECKRTGLRAVDLDEIGRTMEWAAKAAQDAIAAGDLARAVAELDALLTARTRWFLAVLPVKPKSIIRKQLPLRRSRRGRTGS